MNARIEYYIAAESIGILSQFLVRLCASCGSNESNINENVCGFSNAENIQILLAFRSFWQTDTKNSLCNV